MLHIANIVFVLTGVRYVFSFSCKMQVSSEASEEAAEAEGDGGEKRPGGGGGGAVAGGQDGEDASSCYKHRLSNVNFINMGNIQRIKCVVDNQVRPALTAYDVLVLSVSRVVCCGATGSRSGQRRSLQNAQSIVKAASCVPFRPRHFVRFPSLLHVFQAHCRCRCGNTVYLIIVKLFEDENELFVEYDSICS